MNIYELLSKYNNELKFDIDCINLYAIDDSYLDENEKKYSKIIKDVCSMHMQVELKAYNFVPHWVSANGDRTFSIQDVDDNILSVLKELDYDRLPVSIAAKCAEVIWYVDKDKNYIEKILESYIKLSSQDITEDSYLSIRKGLIRGLQLIKQTKNEVYFKRYKGIVENCIQKLYENKFYFQYLYYMEIHYEFYREHKYILQNIDNLYNSLDKNIENESLFIQIYELRKKIYIEEKFDNEIIKQNDLEKAEFCIQINNSLTDEEKNMSKKAQLSEYAITVLSKYSKSDNNIKTEIDNLNIKLISYRKRIINNFIPIYYEINFKKTDDYIKKVFQNLSFKEAVIRLTQFVAFFNYDEIKTRLLADIKKHITGYLFNTCLYTPKGHVACLLKGLDLSNPEKSEDFDKYINRQYITEIAYIGDRFIRRAILFIGKNYKFSEEDFDFIINKNGILSDDNKQTIKKGLHLFFSNKIDMSLYIIVPQIENIFREIIENLGGSIVGSVFDYENHSTSFITLTQIFRNPILRECYENNIIETFRIILDDKSGANLRNYLLHGLYSDAELNSGVSIYLQSLFVKWISLTSIDFTLILSNSKILNDNKLAKVPKNLFCEKVITKIK